MSQIYALICFPFAFCVAAFAFATCTWYLPHPYSKMQSAWFLVFCFYGCFFGLIWFYFHPDGDSRDNESLWVSMAFTFIAWPDLISYCKDKLNK